MTQSIFLASKEDKSRSPFFGGILLAVSVILLGSLVVSLFAANIGLTDDSFLSDRLMSQVAPNPDPEPEPVQPNQPKPLKAQTAPQPEQPQSVPKPPQSPTAPQQVPDANVPISTAPPENPVGSFFPPPGTQPGPPSNGTPSSGNPNGSGTGNENVAPPAPPPAPKPVEPPAPPPDPPKPAAPPVPKIVSKGPIGGQALSLPKPNYSASAKMMRASGPVVVEVLLDEDGKVLSARAISGNMLLRPAAEQAAKQAKFSPTVLGGTKMKVSGTITYNFVL